MSKWIALAAVAFVGMHGVNGQHTRYGDEDAELMKGCRLDPVCILRQSYARRVILGPHWEDSPDYLLPTARPCPAQNIAVDVEPCNDPR